MIAFSWDLFVPLEVNTAMRGMLDEQKFQLFLKAGK